MVHGRCYNTNIFDCVDIHATTLRAHLSRGFQACQTVTIIVQWFKRKLVGLEIGPSKMLPSCVTVTTILQFTISDGTVDHGLFHRVLATIFCRSMRTNIPISRKKFANNIQSGLFSGYGQFRNESDHLFVEKCKLSPGIQLLIAL